MQGQVQKNIEQSLQEAENLYHRLILLVGKAGSGKTSALRDLAQNSGQEVININLEISNKLLELTAKQRTLRLPEIMGQVIENLPSPILLDNLEILFDTHLQQDPLRLLQSISRNRTVLATWNGEISNSRLLYAEMGHPEYRSYDSVDALIVSMDGSATVGSEKVRRN